MTVIGSVSGEKSTVQQAIFDGDARREATSDLVAFLRAALEPQ